MRGRLKIFLGYAAGVGKTYQMLDEGQARAKAGVDVVIGYFEPHKRIDTIAKTEGLETIARRLIEYRGTKLEEMDVSAILARRPQLALVDELPHTNVPGSEHEKRWEDVIVLLNAGIDVYTTMNIQHLESLNDQVHQFTGVQVRETVPDWFMREADEVVLVDLTPGALLNRLDRGAVYATEKAAKARENFFKLPTLVALRELALRQTAQEVDVRAHAAPEGPQEKVLAVVTESPATAMVIRRARRVASYLMAEAFAVYVGSPSGEVDKHLSFARNLHFETRVLSGEDAAAAIVDFAHRNGITQILINRPVGRRDLVFRLLQLAKDFQVTVVGHSL